MGQVFFTEQLAAEYRDLWDKMVVRATKIPAADKIVDVIAANRERYQKVEAKTEVPWFFIAVVHSLEGSLSFKTHLHNGDSLKSRTVHVPKGRPVTGSPPFAWEDSAVDAVRCENLHYWTNWTLEGVLYKLEAFNGFGYRNCHPGVRSPYLWSFSNQYSQGKYVADGEWSDSAVSDQCGAAVLLRRMLDRKLFEFAAKPK